ncbi:MAG TPA: hypothetical protein VK668_01280 [Mucilaginibacter sp.]|nr:hypothetical protein [Mucilaginibacter sp.]
MKQPLSVALLLVMMLLGSCRSAGRVQFYNFISPKADVKKELIRVIDSNGKYSAPPHWNNYEEGEGPKDIFIYFKKGPRELYCVAFNNYDDIPDYKDKTVLALVSVFDGKIWKRGNDLSRAEEKRVEKRFREEILSKMKFYYSKD